MDERDLAYFAGLLDGEGHIGIRKDYRITVDIANNSNRMVRWLLGKFNGVVCMDGCKFRWFLNGREGVMLLLRCEPYLVVKKEEAAFAIRFFLNRRGRSHDWQEKQRQKLLRLRLKRRRKEL
jgi:hypothetical protein